MRGAINLVVLVIGFLQQGYGCETTCGENEVWGGSLSPEPSCDDIFPTWDFQSFKHSCICKANHIRDKNGKCILIKDCPQFSLVPGADQAVDGIEQVHSKCPPGEVWKEGIDPEPSCDVLFPNFKGFREGCFCETDTIRGTDGKCTPPQNCPKYEEWMKQEREMQEIIGDCIPGTSFRVDCNLCVCGENGKPICTLSDCNENKEKKENKNKAEVTTVDNKPIPSALPPNVKQDSVNPSLHLCQSIVPKIQPCEVNEVWREGFHPQATCDNLFPDIDYFETKEDCFCKDDYVKNKEGKCILFNECPQFQWLSDPTSEVELFPFQVDEKYWSQDCLDTDITGKFGHKSCNNHHRGHHTTEVEEKKPTTETPGLFISDPVHLIETILQKLSPKKCESTAFGDFVGYKLKSVDNKSRNSLMHIINNAIFKLLGSDDV